MSIIEQKDELYKNIENIPLIVNCCITGGVNGKDKNKYIPITPDEIIVEAVNLINMGASIVHIHVRDEDGKNTLDPNKYEYVIKHIKEDTDDSFLCISSSGRFGATIEDRLNLFDIGADMVSLTLSSMNFINGASVTSPEDIMKLAEKAKLTGTKLELEAFDIGMLNYALYLKKKGLLTCYEYINVILGSIASAPLDMISLGNIMASIPSTWTCAVGGLGKYQQSANLLGLLSGNHVRVGLEDNLYLKGELTTNKLLLHNIKEHAKLFGRSIATVKQTKTALKM
jgi:3-keto-5-aminohexanoate cleavage enzyme